MIKLLYVTDPHFSGSSPRNRLDDYRETVKVKVREVFALAAKHQVKAILWGGDFWNTPEVSIAVLLDYAELLNEAPVDMYGTPGNHDIFGYNLATYQRSSLRLLEMLVPRLRVIVDPSQPVIFPYDGGLSVTFTPYSGKMDVNGYGYGPEGESIATHDYKIHVAHGMLLDHTPPFDRFTLVQDVQTTADMVLTGHEHIGYGIYRRADGKVFVNPGSLTRIAASAAEVERTVKVALITVDNGQASAELIRLESAKPGPEVLDRSRIEAEKQRQYSMDKFSALIQTHTGGSVLLDVNQIVDQVAKEEQYAPEVVKLALEEIDRQRQVVVGVVPEFGFPKVAGRG